MCFRAELFALIISAIFSLNAMAADEDSCFRRGLGIGLNSEEAGLLCEGSKTDAPVKCYLRSRESKELAMEDSLGLCQCAQNAAPAECVNKVLRKGNLGIQDSVLYCGSISKEELSGGQCVKIKGFS